LFLTERLHAEQLGAPKRKRNKEKVKKDKHTVDSVPAAKYVPFTSHAWQCSSGFKSFLFYVSSPSAKGGTKTEKVHSHGPTGKMFVFFAFA